MNVALPLIDETITAAARAGLGYIEVKQNSRSLRLPLKKVEQHAQVVDRLASVTVSQTFSNPFAEHLEAVYIFPLAGGSAVSSFQMKVGGRIIQGKVEERQAAREEYAAAISAGKRGALLEQERDDVFTVQVGNLVPGEEISVEITYSEKLQYFDQGLCEIRLPLVVAPRYIPGNPLERLSVGDGVESDTDQVPDASRITPPRLAPGVEDKIELKLSVSFDPDTTLEDLSCSQHAMRMSAGAAGTKITLAREDEIMDRDFVLRWRCAADEVQSSFIVYQGEGASYGMISLLPPAGSEIVKAARDVIFVIDRSGSMQGLKMASAARACSFLLATLGPKDRFAIESFDDQFDWLRGTDGDRFICADEGGLEKGMNYLRSITARGGTELHGALQQAIEQMASRADQVARMPVIVVLTDGEVGNEASIFAAIQRNIGENRIFAVGIDSAVNDGFLRRLAALGGGSASFVEPGLALESALGNIGREIGEPLITDLTIASADGPAIVGGSVTPAKLPDLFEGRAAGVFFKLQGAELGKIKITGKYADGKKFSADLSARPTAVKALPQLWAKSFIVDLEDKYRVSSGAAMEQLKKEIVSLSIEHCLLTKFTAFVVVDHSEVVNANGSRRKIVQAVHNPAHWEEEDLAMPAVAPGAWGAAPACSAPASAGAWGAAPACSAPASASGWGSSPAVSGGYPPAWDKSAAFADSSDPWGAATEGPTVAKAAPTPSPDGAAGGFQSFVRRRINDLMPPKNKPLQDVGITTGQHAALPQSSSSPSSSFSSSPSSTPPLPPPLPPHDGWSAGTISGADSNEGIQLANTWSAFDKEIRFLFDEVAQGRVPALDKVTLAKQQLIVTLSLSSMATSLSILQKYLRGDLVSLLAAVGGATTVTDKLRKLVQTHQEKYDFIAADIRRLMPDPAKPFWEKTV